MPVLLDEALKRDPDKQRLGQRVVALTRWCNKVLTPYEGLVSTDDPMHRTWGDKLNRTGQDEPGLASLLARWAVPSDHAATGVVREMI